MLDDGQRFELGAVVEGIERPAVGSLLGGHRACSARSPRPCPGAACSELGAVVEIEGFEPER